MTGIVKRYLDREFDASELHFNQPEFEDFERGEYGEIEFELEHNYNEVFKRAETMARLTTKKFEIKPTESKSSLLKICKSASASIIPVNKFGEF